jgi:polysaccharide pyruvyl transferase WcaK-like protein
MIEGVSGEDSQDTDRHPAMVEAVLLNDTRIDLHHGCTTVIETIDTLAARSGIKVIAKSPAHSNWRADPEITSAIDRADLVIVNGEGTIHHDRPAGIKLLEVGEYAKSKNTKAALINSTWQANCADSLRALDNFDIVTVRESASQGELAGHGVEARRIPDLALYHEPPVSPERKGVGYCDSVQGPKALELYKKMWALDGEPLPIVQLPLDPMTSLRWLLRYGASKSAIFNPAHAMPALRAALQDYREQEPSRDVTTAEVAAKRLVVTGRFHMLIFCLGARTPMLALSSNTHKNEATLADAGLEPWRLIDKPSDLDAAMLERAAQWHGDEAANLDRFLSEGRGAMETLFADLATLARG